MTENERKQTLAQAGQELKEQERQLRNLQEAQKEIAAQLKQIAEQTLGSISQWNATELVKPVASIDTVAAPAAKRGRKPGVKNKPKAVAKVKAAKPKAVKAAVPAKPKAVPAKRGPKPKVQAAKPAAKRGPKPKITLETVSDEGLPTLNKVLEAYAKSSGPRGKVGEIN